MCVDNNLGQKHASVLVMGFMLPEGIMFLVDLQEEQNIDGLKHL